MRILVTGSRTWYDEERIWAELDRAAGNTWYRDVTLVSGSCPSGADQYAEIHAASCGWTVERHPADWQTYGKRAGFVRNAKMVDLGADLCLAFIRNHSPGATMTADLAEQAGIPTRRYTA